MSNKIEITLSSYYSDRDIQELKQVSIGDFVFNPERFPEPEENTGGAIWEGVVIFALASVAAGFFNELGKDTYKSIKKKLLNLKENLQSGNINKFTVNVKFENSMLFFQLTDLESEDFISGIDKIGEFIAEESSYSENNGGFYDAIFNRELKKWELEGNNTFDI